MFSDEQKLKAVELYLQTRSYAVTYRILGYPNSDDTLRRWVKDHESNGKFTNVYQRVERFYTKEEIDFACEYYLECNNTQQVVDELGYPETRMTLWRWLKNKGIITTKKRKESVVFSDEEKKSIIRAYFKSEESKTEFMKRYNSSPTNLNNWIKQFGLIKEDLEMPNNIKQQSEDFSLSNQDDNTDKLKKEIEILKAKKIAADNKVLEAEKELKMLKAKVEQAQLEYDILEKAAELIKKDKGINVSILKNKEKAIVINALRNKYALSRLLKSLKMAKSSYEYQCKALSKDKYKELRETILDIFLANYEAFGYRRIHGELKHKGIIVSEKVVRRLMKEENICPFIPRMKKYSSYEGEISPAVKDLYKHDFKADLPYDKLVTDITEFHIKSGKVYLSPIIDLFDGCPLIWKIGTSPNKELTNSMLIELHNTIPKDSRPIIHSDRGSHYRIPDWISMMNEFGYIRSMSRKGCSPDNAACEGYFGILKREFFYNHDWSNTTIEEFINELDKYLNWFKTKRIKERLGYLSPIDYRTSLGY